MHEKFFTGKVKLIRVLVALQTFLTTLFDKENKLKSSYT